VVQAVDRIRKSDHGCSALRKSIRLLIGLFCTKSFDYNAFVEGKQERVKIDTWKVDRLDVKGSWKSG
jgi:coenzyme F420 hydrogenase subunit beta